MKSTKRLWGILALAILCNQLAGCSIFFSQGPPSPPRRKQPFDCSGDALPIIDTIMAGSAGLSVVSTVATGSAHGFAENAAIVLPGLFLMALSVASAGHGYKNADACEKSQADTLSRPHELPNARPSSSVTLEPAAPPAVPADTTPHPNSPFQE